MPVETIIEDARWEGLALPDLADRAARSTLERLGLDPGACEVSLLACDDARIAALNAEFRGKAKPTNVLSWPSEERAAGTPGDTPDLPQAGPGEMLELGDIAIAYETCAREAATLDRDLSAHLCHLLVHGVLHLLGYDHMTEADAALMERLEVEILAYMGVDDPY